MCLGIEFLTTSTIVCVCVGQQQSVGRAHLMVPIGTKRSHSPLHCRKLLAINWCVAVANGFVVLQFV